jgi:hypothetical protein
MNTHRVEAALEAWPLALAAVDRSDSSAIETLTRFADFLIHEDRSTEATELWDRLVDRGIIHSGRLEPAKGISIADPEFSFPLLAAAFGWRVMDNPGVYASKGSGSIRFELNGDEPQGFTLLSVLAPVLSPARYRFTFKADGSALDAPRDPGFTFQIVQQPGGAITQCPPLLAGESPPSCDFATLAGTRTVRIDLRYARAQGTTRAAGTLQMSSVGLEFAR